MLVHELCSALNFEELNLLKWAKVARAMQFEFALTLQITM